MFYFNNLFHPLTDSNVADRLAEWYAFTAEEVKNADFQFRILSGWKKISRFAETFRYRGFAVVSGGE